MNTNVISDGDREAYYLFLDDLREVGCCNMFGATPYLREEFPELNEQTGRQMLSDWMSSFDKRHPNG